MKFHVHQFLEFENSVAKINKITGNNVTLRKMTQGKTWDYQQAVTLTHLQKLHKVGKLHCIDHVTILRLLSAEKITEGGVMS